MNIGIIVATIMFCFYLYQYIEEKKQAKKEEEDRFFEELKNGNGHNEIVADEPTDLDERTTTELVLCTLRKIGCEPETEELRGLTRVYITYQGEKFTIECNDSCRFIVIYDTWWFHISVYSDVEDIANLHKVINLTNQHANVTVIHTVNDEMEEIGVHSRKNILFIPQIPHIDKYLVSTLDDFFVVQRHVVREFEKFNVREEQNA
jgi:hypothetical protein